jgi:hypothetical protein
MKKICQKLLRLNTLAKTGFYELTDNKPPQSWNSSSDNMAPKTGF